MRKIYIAGGSTERLTVVKSWMDQVRAYSTKFKITHDWTTDPGYDAPSKDQGYESALKDLREGIDPADVVWLIVPEKPSEGQAVELGYAYAKASTSSSPDFTWAAASFTASSPTNSRHTAKHFII
jgi:hypothetical protein